MGSFFAMSNTTRKESVDGALRFGPQNFLFLALGLASVVAGYFLLSGGSTVAAPLLLVVGYVILIPIGIVR